MGKKDSAYTPVGVLPGSVLKEQGDKPSPQVTIIGRATVDPTWTTEVQIPAELVQDLKSLQGLNPDTELARTVQFEVDARHAAYLVTRGVREGLTWVLNHLNTYETKLIDKTLLYKTLLETNPEEIAKHANNSD